VNCLQLGVSAHLKSSGCYRHGLPSSLAAVKSRVVWHEGTSQGLPRLPQKLAI